MRRALLAPPVGTFRSQGSAVRAAVAAALAATPPSGVLHIDTASIYKNEADIALALAGVPRSRVFLTSKLSPYEQGYAAALAATDGILSRLGVSALDMLLIHWPGVSKAAAASPANAAARAETWRALEALHAAGRVRALGVSNYTEAHLAQLLAHAAVKPVVNQVECHPALQQRPLRAACAAAGVAVVAYSPLGTGALLAHPAVTAVAARARRTPAQVLLRWALQSGLCVIPKSTTPARVAENADVWGWALSEEDMAALDGVEAAGGSQRFCWDPTGVA